MMKWLQGCKRLQELRLRQRGFDWAAGRLLEGMSMEELESHISSFDYNAFDSGVEDAISAWGRAA